MRYLTGALALLPAIVYLSVAGFLAATPAGQATGLRTAGSQIVDAAGRPVRLAAVNWYGFETADFVVHGLTKADYHQILTKVKQMGFNTLRLPFSNEMVEKDPIPTAIAFSGPAGPMNEDLQGLTSLEVLDKIIDYSGQLGLMVILDNHRSDADSDAQENGLWHTPDYPETTWITHWQLLAARYKNSPAVVAMDLRNEPHTPPGAPYGSGATWGDGSANDWRLAAQRAGNAVLSVNPELLIIVEGISDYPNSSGDYDRYWWGGNLLGVRQYPVELSLPNRLVYSAHDYGPDLYLQPWFNAGTTYDSLASVWDKYWGYVARENLAPVLVGEFGTTNRASDVSDAAPGSQGQWFSSLVQYIKRSGLGWAYWTLNGEDHYGLLDATYDHVALPQKAEALRGLSLPYRLYLPEVYKGYQT